MNTKLAWGITAVVLLPLAAGCTQGAGIVRGQNPGEAPPPAQVVGDYGPGGAVGYPGPGPAYPGPGYPGGACPVCASGHGCPLHSGYPGAGGYPGAAGYPGYGRPLPYQHVLSHGPHRAGGRGQHPTHYHWYSYEQPQDLVYPQPNQPAAVIQYPYYTVKGPSDFFMK